MSEGSRNLTVEAAWTADQQPNSDSVTLSMKLNNDDAIDVSGSYKLIVQVNGSQGSVFNNETSVQLMSPAFLTFVQTDKAVYQPGQTVKFRVISLDETLRPVFANFTVLLKDAQGNLVDRFRHEVAAANDKSAAGRNVSDAVMHGQFDLADLPNLGEWNIEASGGRGQYRTKSFTVERYVLPKFSIDIQLPEFVRYEDEEFNVTATVRYTYRQAVQGRVKAELGPWSPCRSCKASYDFVKTFEVDLDGSGEGRATFAYRWMAEWRDALAKRAKEFDMSFDGMRNFNAKVFIQFTEKFSGVIKTADATFTIYQMKNQLSVQIPNVSFFLPGMRVPVQMSLTRPDGKPFTGNLSSDVRLVLSFSQRNKPRSKEIFRGRLTPAASGTGISLVVTVPEVADFLPITFTGRVLSESESEEASASLNPFMAVTDDFVLAGLQSDDEEVQLRVNKSSGIKLTYAAVLSRGQIHKFNNLNLAKDGKLDAAVALKIPLKSLVDLIPSFSVIVLGVVESGEMVASYADYSVPNVTGKLNLSTNLTSDTGKPQDFATVRVSGDPNTFVFVAGIDASVNLIRTGQDILESTVTDALRDGQFGLRGISWAETYTTDTVLEKASLKLLSDGFYYKENRRRPIFFGGIRARSMTFGASVMEMASVDAERTVSAKTDDAPEKSQKRQFFPETMIWAMVETDSSGQASHTLQLPDTITSWDVTAFGVSDHSAIQTVSRALKVTTFKQFFAQPMLPNSLIRGETLVLRVLLFNYHRTEGTTADVTIALDDAFEAQPDLGRSVEVAIGPNGVGLATFSLRPKNVTEAAAVSVRARAIWPGGRAEVDEVARTLPVLPEGWTVRRTHTALLSLAASGNESETDARASLAIEWPSAVQPDGTMLVPGSEVLSLSVIGDALGPAMDGIGGLVRTPHGCGEQNMVDFAPAVFVYRYLASSPEPADAAAEGLRKKCLAAMRTGYQRQLAFRRSDGSYSAFGNLDSAGSVWLTAFVLSVFAQAAKFVTIDPGAVTGNSVAFVLSRQDASGRFSEPEGARVLDSGLQGASGKASLGMTAFVCTALLDVWEAMESTPALSSPNWSKLPVASSLVRCLDLFGVEFGQRPGDFDARDLGLTAHFLWRLRRSALRAPVASDCAPRVLAAFSAQSVSTDGGASRHWEVSSQPSDEVTAYGVLSALMSDGAESALPSLRWLSSRQTDRGGFSDTQSTVVAVRALAAFAEATGGSGPTHARVELQAAQATGQPPLIFDVQPDTRRVLQRRLVGRGPLASQAVDIGVHAVGRGLVLATASWQYNLRDPERRFLTANWTDRGGVSLRLGAQPQTAPGAAFAFSVCARSNAGEGMYILRMSCPSGYLPVDYTQARGDSNPKLVEASADQLVFYLDKLSTTEFCVQSGWQRDVPVLNVGPQMITLQKYYQPDVSNTAFYLDPKLQSVTVCQACPDCRECGQH